MKGLEYLKKLGIQRVISYVIIGFIIIIMGYIFFNFGSFMEGFNKEWDSK